MSQFVPAPAPRPHTKTGLFAGRVTQDALLKAKEKAERIGCNASILVRGLVHAFNSDRLDTAAIERLERAARAQRVSLGDLIMDAVLAIPEPPPAA